MLIDSAVNQNVAKKILLNQKTSNIIVLEKKISDDLIDYISGNKQELMKNLMSYGGVLFRNYQICSASQFNQVANTVCEKLYSYVYRSTPRTCIGGKLYTATEYPADKIIPLHNENSYSNHYPDLIMFCCLISPQSGGQTPLVDSHIVYKKIDKNIRLMFAEKGVMYRRNYTQNLDLDWQQVFQTEDTNAVEEYCKNNEIEYQWSDNKKNLQTNQIRPGIMEHPKSGKKLWFNQAHLFHDSVLEQPMREILIKEYGKENLPRNAYFGDGSPIPESFISHINRVYSEEKFMFDWQYGDVLILDNFQIAHGREKFSGERKIIVAMGC